MRDDDVTKRRKLHETATGNGTYIYQNPQEKQSLHQISYQWHGCLVGDIYMSVEVHMSIVCETQHKTIIRRNKGVYIFDILHMIQNPHLYVGHSHLTIKSLKAIKHVVSFTPCGRLLQIVQPWKAKLFIPKLIVFTFGWTNLDPPRVQ